MKVGRLRHRITIEELVTDYDSDGAAEVSWFTVGRGIPAEISDLSGGELVAAAAVQSKVATRIKIRYRPGLKASMRVLHRDAVYNIEAITRDLDSRIHYATLHCTTGVNQG